MNLGIGLSLSRRAGATWTPTALQGQGLQLWLSAPDEPGGYADAAAVGSIADFSGNARAASAAGSARPTFRVGALKGRNAYRFDGIDDLAATPAFVLSTVGIYVVAKVSNTGGMVYEHGPATAPGDGNYINSTAGTASFSATLTRASTTSSQSAQTASWCVSATGAILAQEFLGTHATHKIYRDSLTAMATATFSGLSGNPGSGNTASQAFNIGNRSTGSFATAMDLGELIVVSPTTNAITQQVIAYLAARWGITLV